MSIFVRGILLATWGAACSSLVPNAYAGAWTLDQGGLIIITTLDEVSADKFFGPKGDKKSELDYQKSDIRLYAEYGVIDGITLVAESGFQSARINGPNQTARSRSGFSNLDAGLRYRIWNGDNFVLSVQAMISARKAAYGLPGAPLSLTESGTDFDVRVMAGHSWDIRGYDGFSDVQIGRREFGNGGGKSLNIDITTGIEINPDLQLLGQAFFIDYQGDRSHKSVRIQPSLVYKANQNRKYQIGAFAIAAGENATQDRGVTLSVWQTY